MSILIKGMEMPTNCSACKFFDHGDCELLPYGDYIDDKHKRRDNCPLIELPPHGRLIDADALRDKWIWGTTDRLGYTKCIEVVDLDDAPTIIEAEDEP